MKAEGVDPTVDFRPLLALFDRPEPPLLLVVGTGVSLGAAGDPCSTWRGLLEHGIDYLERAGVWSSDRAAAARHRAEDAFGTAFNLSAVLEIAQAITDDLGGPSSRVFASWLRDSVGALRIRSGREETLAAIADLMDAGAVVMTTNYDDLLCEALGLPAVTWEEPQAILQVINRQRRAVIHIHGHWRRPTSIVFGNKSYDDIVRADVLQSVFKSLWLQWHWLYVGVGAGLDDANLGQLIAWGSDHFGASGLTDYFLGTRETIGTLKHRFDRLANVVAVVYDAHADLPGVLRLLSPEARCSPFGRLSPTSPQFRQVAESSITNPSPTWTEFINGTVPELPADDEIEKRLAEHGWCMIFDVRSVGKTTLALRIATRPEQRNHPVYVLELRETREDESTFETDAYAALQRISRPGSLLILDNAHLNPELTRMLWRSWLERSHGSRLLILAARVESAIRIAGGTALLEIEQYDPSNPPVAVRPGPLDLQHIFEQVMRRLWPRVDLKLLAPPLSVLKEWHTVFGAELGAFVTAIIQRRRHLLTEDWNLPESAAAEWMEERYLSKLSAQEIANVISLSAFATDNLELDVDEEALPHPRYTAPLLRIGLARRVGAAGDRTMRLGLRAPAWSRLILQGLTPPPDVALVRIDAARRSISLALALDSRLRRTHREREREALWSALDAVADEFVARAADMPMYLIVRLMTSSQRARAYGIVDAIWKMFADDVPAAVRRIEEVSLGHVATFFTLAREDNQLQLAEALWATFVTNPRRLIENAFDTSVGNIARFLRVAAEQNQATLAAALWTALTAWPERLAEQAFQTDVRNVKDLLEIARLHKQVPFVAKFWEAVFTLEREVGMHDLAPQEKYRLLEHVAASRWRADARAWTFAEMERALPAIVTTLAPRLSDDRFHDMSPSDLRAAVVRAAAGDIELRFEAGSILEFFLAEHLVRALREGRVDDWKLPLPSTAVLDILSQFLQHEVDGAAWATLRSMCNAYRPQSSELVFAYLIFAHSAGYLAPTAAGMQLDGADLRKWRIGAPDDKPLLDLRGVSFRDTRLAGARFWRVDLDGADFSGADLALAEVHGSRASGASFEQSVLHGAIFRGVDLSAARFRDARWYRTQILRCRLKDARYLALQPPQVLVALAADTPAEVLSVHRGGGRFDVFCGHSDAVRTCAFTPDGELVVSGSDDETLRLWDAITGEPIAILRAHDGGVQGCDISPGERWIASASSDHTVRLWDIVTGTCVGILAGHDESVECCVFSPDGTLLASGSADHTLRIWDTETGDCLSVLHGHTDSVNACAFSADGHRIVSASDDKQLITWDVASGSPLSRLTGHEAAVTGDAFLGDAQIISSSADATVRVWTEVSGEISDIWRGHTKAVSSCAVAPTGRRVASSSYDQTVRIWNPDSGDCCRILQGHRDRVRQCRFSTDGLRIVSASDDHTVRVWDLSADEASLVLPGHKNPVRACAIDRAGKRVVSGGDDGTLRIWSAQSGKCLRILNGHAGAIQSCTFSRDGQLIASASYDLTVRIWDATSGAAVRVMRGHEEHLRACTFGPDGMRVVSASYDHTVRVWDVGSGRCTGVLRGHGDRVLGCATHPDGERIASVSDDRTARIWKYSGACVNVLSGHGGPVQGCAYAPDGDLLVTASYDMTVRVWDSDSGDCLRILRGHTDRVLACVFSADGRFVASGSSDHTLRVWDLRTAQCVSLLRGHHAGVRSCAFSPDGLRLLSSGEDGTVRVWDIATGRETQFRIYVLNASDYVSLAPDADRLIEVGGNAWRSLGWSAVGPNGRLTRYPAEFAGPLPMGQAVTELLG